MKPVHLAMAAAILAVGALVWWMAGSTDARREAARDTAAQGGGEETPERGETPERTGLALTVAVALPGGEPAQGAAIRLRGPSPRGADANADGRARFDGLPAGRYDVTARSGSLAAAETVELAADRELALQLSQGLAVTGRVFSARGEPLAGAAVEAARQPERKTATWFLMSARAREPDAVVADARTAADGRYELLLPGPGGYALRAGAVGFATAEESRRIDAPLDGVDFHLDPGAAVEGRVLDPDDRPVAGALVVLSVSRGFLGGGKSAGVTGADGTFRLPPPGTTWMSLFVEANGFAEYVQNQLRTPVAPLTIRLERGLALQARAVDDRTGRGLPGLQALLVYGAAVRESETGDGGEIRFERLPTEGGRGPRQLIVSGGRYVPRIVDLGRAEAVDGVIDAGDVDLQLGGVVRGRVLEKEGGRPVGGAHVLWWARQHMQAMGLDSARTTSDENGVYELVGVPLDANAVFAAHEDYVPDFDLRQAFQKPEPLFPEGRTQLEKDLFLEPATAVEGLVLTPAGEPAPDALVNQAWQGGFLPGQVQQDIRSDAAGRFTIKTKNGQQLTVQASHRAYGESEPVTVKAGSGEPLTLHLTAALGVWGTVVDEEGAPVPGVAVTVAPEQRGAVRFPATAGATGATDAEGRFVVRNAPAGEVTVSFDHAEYLPARRPISVAVGAERYDLGEVVLGRGPGIGGVVVDADGNPLAGIPVTASLERMPGDVRGDETQGRTWSFDTTDAEGRFALHGLREGRHTVWTNRDGMFGDRPLVATGTRDVKIVLRPAAVLRGRVLGEAGPVASAWVRGALPGRGHLSTTRTDDDGRFELGGLPPDESFTLTVSHQEYEQLEVPGVRADGAPRELTLSRGAGFAGVVVEEDGAPVAGAALAVYVNGKRAKNTRTDEAGRFRVGGLAAGAAPEVEIAWTPIGHVKTGRIPVRLGDEAVRIVLERGEKIEGVLLDKEGAPVMGRVDAVDGEGNVAAQAWSFGGQGEFAIQGLPKGRYLLRVSRFADGQWKTLLELADVATGGEKLTLRVPD